MELLGAWGGGGTVDAGSGLIDLGGTFNPAAALWKRTGDGSVRVTGVLDLTSQPLVLDATTGGWTVQGGTLRGGTVELRDGVGLTLGGNALLEGVTLKGLASGMVGHRFRIKGGLTLEGSLRLPGAQLDIVGTQTITGGSVELSYANGWTPAVNVPADAELTLSATTVLRGGGGYLQGDGSVRNLGTLRADLPNQTLMVRPKTLVHLGLAEKHRTMEPWNCWAPGAVAAPWTRAPASSIWAGRSNPAAALWKRTGDGSVRVTGVLDLTSQPLVLDATTGGWTVQGGTLRGGTVELRDGVGFTLGGNALLEGVTLKGLASGMVGHRFRIKGGLTLEGSLRLPGAQLDIVGTQTITGGSVELSYANG